MSFHALRVECPVCHRSFLVGGGQRSDAARWYAYDVECPSCRSPVQTAGGELVPLRMAPEAEAAAIAPGTAAARGQRLVGRA
jgi:hypothetical protein